MVYVCTCTLAVRACTREYVTANKHGSVCEHAYMHACMHAFIPLFIAFVHTVSDVYSLCVVNLRTPALF